MNTCYNAVDYHVETGRAKQAAIIYDSPMTGTIRRISYEELQGPHVPLCRCPGSAGSGHGRSRDHLYAHDP